MFAGLFRRSTNLVRKVEVYVTVLDELFLPQFIVLHKSMLRTGESFKLYAIAVTSLSRHFLEQLELPEVVVIPIELLETKELREAKKDRTRAEYCWTLTPFAVKAVMNLEIHAPRVTYLDADLWFLQSPSIIFRAFERSNGSVLLTDHSYASSIDFRKRYGRFCVQFMSFVQANSGHILDSWGSECLEWCYNKVEKRRFGDQKYLDEWPQKYEKSVYILEPHELAQGPWNMAKFRPSEAIFFHFHALRLRKGQSVAKGTYHIPSAYQERIYGPYTEELLKVTTALKRMTGLEFQQRKKSQLWEVCLRQISRIYRV